MQDSNQHFVTKAYLDNFVLPNASQQILYPFRKGGRRCKPRGTRRLGSATNFFRQRVDGALSDCLDEARGWSERLYFSNARGNESPFIKCVNLDDYEITDVERLYLAGTAALLFCSSPVQIHNSAMMNLLIAQMDLFNSLNREEVIAEYAKECGNDAQSMLERDRQAVLAGELFADPPQGTKDHKQLGFFVFKLEKQIIELLMNMRLTIVNCHPNSIFLTSDNPVVRNWGSGSTKPDDFVWLPISWRRGLMWHRAVLFLLFKTAIYRSRSAATGTSNETTYNKN